MSALNRRDLVLLLLGIGTPNDVGGGIGGITRLQKLLFLLEEEEDLRLKKDGFEFAAYKAGPYSARLYDDLEFLENLGMIQSEVAGEATEPEASEVDLLTFDELIGDGAEHTDGGDADGIGAADAYQERRYTLTEKGRKRVARLIDSGEYKPFVEGIRKVKSKYAQLSLSDLLYYVYTKYPDMTMESEIKNKVLRRRRRS